VAVGEIGQYHRDEGEAERDIAPVYAHQGDSKCNAQHQKDQD